MALNFRGFNIPNDLRLIDLLLIEERDLIPVADPDGAESAAVGEQELGDIDIVAVIEHHGPARLVGQVDGK